MGKAPWIINFLLNTITKPYRAKFISGVISENLWLIEDDVIKLRIIETMGRVQDYPQKPNKGLYDLLVKDYEYLREKREEIKKQIAALGAQAISMSQESFEKKMSQSQFLKGILFFLVEMDGNLTRSSVSFFRQLGEAIQWKFMRDLEVDYNKKTLENCAFMLIDYVGFFVDTDEKGV